MIKFRRRRPYWKRTKFQIFASLVLPGLVMLATPLYVDTLNVHTLAGFPLGYLISTHGTILFAMVAVFHFVARQDAVDRWHGAHEDI
ncbi:MAG: sodium/substrate symporter small subunit [Pseudomonadota bacterium]